MCFLKKLMTLASTLFIVAASTALAVSKKELKIAVSQEFEHLNPIISQMATTRFITDMSVRSILTLNPDGEWVPFMIKEIPSFENGLASFFTENGVKKIRAHFELKENLKFGDGHPITAEDIKFTWSVGMNENISIGEREIWSQIERVILYPENARKFTFEYAKARWDFNQLPQFYVIPKHLEEPIIKKYGNKPGEYEKHSLYVTDSLNPGLYQGPYRLSELKLGSHIILVPNEHFYGKAPYFEKIIIKVIQNTNALEANLMSGTVDMISNLGLTFDQAVAAEKRIKKQNKLFEVVFEPGLVYEHIDLQLDNPLLKDINVRKALVYGINREALVNALFEGKQQVAVHNIAPVDPWYTDDPKDIVLYPFSRRKARGMLKKAGWIMGDDGYRYKNGEKLTFQLMTTAGNKTREMVEAYLQEQWKQIGVEITIKNEPARVYFGETVRKSLYPAMAMYAWWSSPENNPRSTMFSGNIPTKENDYSGQNSMRWSNKEVDQLLDEMDVEFKHENRLKIIAKILYHYTNEVPVIPLYYRSNNSIIPKNLAEFRISPHQFGAENFVEYWHLK